jgi:hypothetical protein
MHRLDEGDAPYLFVLSLEKGDADRLPCFLTISA